MSTKDPNGNNEENKNNVKHIWKCIDKFVGTVGHNIIDLEKRLGSCCAKIRAQIRCPVRMCLDQLTCGGQEFILGSYNSLSN